MKQKGQAADGWTEEQHGDWKSFSLKCWGAKSAIKENWLFLPFQGVPKCTKHRIFLKCKPTHKTVVQLSTFLAGIFFHGYGIN